MKVAPVENREHSPESVQVMLKWLYQEGFFGTVTLQMQNGLVKQIEVKRVFKPGDALS